ncbi:MAG: hypothetical protein QM811_30030 [Pirellulales bacterium]
MADALAADRFDVAKSVGLQLAALTQKFGDAALKKQVAGELVEVQRLERVFADVGGALKTLETDPKNPAANDLVGKYRVSKRDWKGALPCLSLSSDPTYRDPAVKESAVPRTFEDRMAVAEEWWKLGEAEKSPMKEHLQVHAGEWYEQAGLEATGLNKAKIEARLAAVAKIAGPAKVADTSIKTSPNKPLPGANAAPERLTIVSARWGGGNNWTDVTARAQEGVKKNEWVWATTDYLRADPTPGWRKTLEITFLKDGQNTTSKIGEGGAFKPSKVLE